MRTHAKSHHVGGAIYTMPGRLQPAPRVERVWLGVLDPSPVEAGTSVGLVPYAPGLPGGWDSPAAPMSQTCPILHLPLGKSTSRGKAKDIVHGKFAHRTRLQPALRRDVDQLAPAVA